MDNQEKTMNKTNPYEQFGKGETTFFKFTLKMI